MGQSPNEILYIHDYSVQIKDYNQLHNIEKTMLTDCFYCLCFTARYVISVTNAPSGHATPKIIPATSTNQIQMGTVQNSWLDERKLFANQGNLPLENYDHHKGNF